MQSLALFFRNTGWRLSLAGLSDLARPKNPVRAEGLGPSRQGSICLVGAGPGARDLMTLRAVTCLQSADVVFFDRLIEAEILDLIPASTERVYVGKEVGAHAWPQDRINAAIVAEARRGRRVVRLKSGDPGIFGRAGEEIATARAAGIPVEIVPGVTAASAAAAAAGQSLTMRGVSDTLILTTGQSAEGAPLPDSARLASPGTTLCFYMSVRQSGRIMQALLNRGMPGDAPVQIAVDVSKPSQRLVATRLDALGDCLKAHGITGCAMIQATWPASASASAPTALKETVLA